MRSHPREIENEFGSYGDIRTNPLDMQYIMHLVSLAQTHLGNETVLYTTDGGAPLHVVGSCSIVQVTHTISRAGR